jgi:hypothetical protein
MKLFICLIALTMVAPAAHAQPGPSPLFAAFQKFCADPDMTPQEIRMAVESAGGKLAGPPGSTNSPQPMYVVAWNVTVQDHKFLINAEGVRAPYGPNMIQDSVSCSVWDYDSDGAAKTELNQWMAIAPSVSGPESATYDFEWDGQKHIPAPPDGEASRADSDAGKIWTLTISGSGKFTTVMLVHFLKPKPKP